jgi:2-hydroxy-3-oxopropionate reductase
VDHSSIDARAAKTIHADLAKKQIGYLDAPVTGGTPSAINGTLTVFVGGETNVLDKVKSIMTAYAQQIHHMGDSGTGQLVKVCNQHLLFVIQLAICEMVNLARQLGLDVKKLEAAFKGNLFDSKIWQLFGGAVISEEPKKYAHIQTLLKDSEYIHNAAKTANSPIPLSSATTELIRMAINKGMGEQDITTLINLFKSAR